MRGGGGGCRNYQEGKEMDLGEKNKEKGKRKKMRQTGKKPQNRYKSQPHKYYCKYLNIPKFILSEGWMRICGFKGSTLVR